MGCSREIAERATLNMDYDLSMAMQHAMYMQLVYLARQSPTSPDVTKRFKKDDDGTVTANATDSMQMLKIPYYAYLDNFLYNEEINETVCFNEKDLEAMFTEETAVTVPKMGTYMAVKEVCVNVVLTCDKWEDYNLMKDENSLTPEQLITYLGDDLLPTVHGGCRAATQAADRNSTRRDQGGN